MVNWDRLWWILTAIAVGLLTCGLVLSWQGCGLLGAGSQEQSVKTPVQTEGQKGDVNVWNQMQQQYGVNPVSALKVGAGLLLMLIGAVYLRGLITDTPTGPQAILIGYGIPVLFMGGGLALILWL